MLRLVALLQVNLQKTTLSLNHDVNDLFFFHKDFLQMKYH